LEVFKENKQLWQCALFYPNKYNKGKGKVIPAQALTGPEGSVRLRLPVVLIVHKWRW